MYKPIIGITMGDPASIGPEIALKALLDARVQAICKPILVGDAAVFRQIASLLQIPIRIHAVEQVSEAQFVAGEADVLDLKNADLSKVTFGEISSEAGNASFDPVTKLIHLALHGGVNRTAARPIHTHYVVQPAHHIAGHTEMYADYTRTIRDAK